MGFTCLMFPANLSTCLAGIDQPMPSMSQLSNASAKSSYPPICWVAARKKPARYHATHGAHDRWSDYSKSLLSFGPAPQAVPKMLGSCKHMRLLVTAHSLKLNRDLHCQELACLAYYNGCTESPTRLNHPLLHRRVVRLSRALGRRAGQKRSGQTGSEHARGCRHL